MAESPGSIPPQIEDSEASKPLHRSDKLLIEEYLRCFNATRAYLKLHPKASYNAARVSATRRLAKANVRAALAERLREIQLSTDEALKLLADQARGDIADLMELTTMGFTLSLVDKDEKTGDIKPKPQTKLIRKIEQKTVIYSGKREDEDREEHTIRLELYSAKDAIDTILKVAGKLKDTTIQIDFNKMSDDDLSRFIQDEIRKLGPGDPGSAAPGDTLPESG